MEKVYIREIGDMTDVMVIDLEDIERNANEIVRRNFRIDRQVRTMGVLYYNNDTKIFHRIFTLQKEYSLLTGPQTVI